MSPKLFESINIKKTANRGEYGLPEYYPTPPSNDNLLFYIQRNQNMNTVVYEINKLFDGRINENYPMHVFWLRYSDNGEIQELNYIQNKLAYGYTSKKITPNTFEFQLVSYKKLKFYIDMVDDGTVAAYAKINQKMSKVEHIYVYVEDFGLFPDVKYIELYGIEIANNAFNYEKIYI
jgi:hypothetical protein